MTEVLIVGAGPVGLCCAIDLLRRGISCRIIERASEHAVGTRARGISARTQEAFDCLGVLPSIRRFAEPSLPTRFCGSDGRLVREVEPRAAIPSSPAIPYPNAIMVGQQNTDSILRGRLADLGGVVEMSSLLTGLSQTGDAVTATVAKLSETETVRASYVIGSDGGRSKVRELAGLRLTGEEWQDANSYLIANLSVSGVDREHWHFWTSPAWGYLTLQPIFHGQEWLFAATVSATETGQRTTPTALSLQHLFEERLPSTKVSFGNLTWHSLYRRHLKVADRYRNGRVFLAGDSAHVGVEHGMNIGIQDGLNLTWKLTHALRGAADSLLDTYEEERRPIAEEILSASLERDREKSSPSSAADSISRAVTGGRGANDPTQLGVNYRNSRLSHQLVVAGGVRAGDRAPDAPGLRSAEGQGFRLFELLDGTRFTLLHFTAVTERELQNVPEEIEVWRILKPGAETDGTGRSLVDEHGHAHSAYGGGREGLVLVRPDGYIAATGNVDQLPEILQAAAFGIYS